MTTATAESPAVARTAPPAALADLILVRLLPTTKTRPGPGQIRKDVAPFFRHPPAEAAFASALADLRTAGLITPDGKHPTDSGRDRARAFLQSAELPANLTWPGIKSKFLAPIALGFDPSSADDAKVFGTYDKLAPYLLKRKLGLPVGTPVTLNGVFEAIACRALERSGVFTLKQLRDAVLAELVESPILLTAKDLNKQVPKKLLGAKKGGMEGLRQVALSGWIENADAPAPEQVLTEPFDLEAFANTVLAAARDCPTGRFAGNKVFIHSVWDRLREEPGFPRMDFPTFQRRLIEANAARLVTLQLADLGFLADTDLVRASETKHLNATFHLIVIPEPS